MQTVTDNVVLMVTDGVVLRAAAFPDCGGACSVVRAIRAFLQLDLSQRETAHVVAPAHVNPLMFLLKLRRPPAQLMTQGPGGKAPKGVSEALAGT